MTGESVAAIDLRRCRIVSFPHERHAYGLDTEEREHEFRVRQIHHPDVIVDGSGHLLEQADRV